MLGSAVVPVSLPFPVAILGGAVVAMVLAVPIGYLSVRRTGIYFAMVTLAFAQMLYFIANQWRDVTGGENGLQGIPKNLGGLTDIDRGILLCRFHHMELHHGGWRITREGRADFLLHPPPGRGHPIVLRPRLALRYAWADLAPPPQRFRPAVA